jgi:hypothetical protein
LLFQRSHEPLSENVRARFLLNICVVGLYLLCRSNIPAEHWTDVTLTSNANEVPKISD